MENATISLFTHPTVLTAMFVGAGVLILVYILKLIRKDEDVVVQKSKSKLFGLNYLKRSHPLQHNTVTYLV